MEIKPRQVLARKRILNLSIAIRNAIDKQCLESNYEITYSEINSALLEILKSNNDYELRSLWEGDESDENN